MLKYVRWCKSLEDFASGRDSSVTFRTRRYSLKKLSSICCFLWVNGKQLRDIVFKVSPMIIMSYNYINLTDGTIHPHPCGRGILAQLRWIYMRRQYGSR